jgi:hypothetical protein
MESTGLEQVNFVKNSPDSFLATAKRIGEEGHGEKTGNTIHRRPPKPQKLHPKLDYVFSSISSKVVQFILI